MGRIRIDPASHEYLHEPERGKSACPTFAGVSPCESHGDFVEAWIENVAAMPGTVHHGAMGLRYVLLRRWSDVVDFLGIWAWDYPRCARSLLFEIPNRTDCLEVGGFQMSHIDDAVSHQRLCEGLCGDCASLSLNGLAPAFSRSRLMSSSIMDLASTSVSSHVGVGAGTNISRAMGMVVGVWVGVGVLVGVGELVGK